MTMTTTFNEWGHPVDQIHAGGAFRKLPRYNRTSDPGRGLFKTFGAVERDDAKLIPESQWKEVDWSHFVVGIKDQDGLGACLCYAAAGILECTRAMAGLDPLPLNAMHLYGQLRYPNDNGSEFEEVLQLLSTSGVITESTLSDDPKNWNPQTWPGSWKKEANLYRPEEVFDLPTRQHIGSAIQLGYCVLLGVSVTDGFEPDKDGVIRPYRVGPLNHGVYACGMKKMLGEWYVDLVNSWSTKWGKEGRAWFPLSCLPPKLNSWCIRAPIIPSNDPMWGGK
jgi:hypothetical protein